MYLILASKSPRRIEILKQLGFAFDAIPAQREEKSTKVRPSARVVELATQKAFEVAEKYPHAVVIGADTLVYCGGEIIGKPKNEKDALRILRKLNNAWQRVYTGMCIVCWAEQKMLYGYDVSYCKARKLSVGQLARLAGKHLDKAGAYAVQDEQDPFIARIVGSRSNVVGFPVEFFNRLWKEFNK